MAVARLRPPICAPSRSAARSVPTCPTRSSTPPLDYEALRAAIGAMLGHGGIVAFDDTVDMARMARYAMEFCAIESCGKCTPCRIGSTRGHGTHRRYEGRTVSPRNQSR